MVWVPFALFKNGIYYCIQLRHPVMHKINYTVVVFFNWLSISDGRLCLLLCSIFQWKLSDSLDSQWAIACATWWHELLQATNCESYFVVFNVASNIRLLSYAPHDDFAEPFHPDLAQIPLSVTAKPRARWTSCNGEGRADLRRLHRTQSEKTI